MLEDALLAAAITLADEIVPYVCVGHGRFDWQYPFDLARRLQSTIHSSGFDFTSYEVISLRQCADAFCFRIVELEKAAVIDFRDRDEFWDMFVCAWNKVTHLENEDPLERAFRLSWSASVVLPTNFGSTRLVEIASIAFHLQQQNGDDPILLPIDRLADLFGCSKQRVSCLLTTLRDQIGIITMEKEYVPHTRAREYRFQLNRTDLYSPP